MEGQNWDTITLHTKPTISRQERIQKQNQEGTKKFQELDSDSPPAPKKISIDIRKTIQQARSAKGMTQKDLAIRLCVPLNVITDYESGKAIPDRVILNRIAQILDVKITKV